MTLREFFVKVGFDVDKGGLHEFFSLQHLLDKVEDKIVEGLTEFVGEFIEKVKQTAEAGEKIELLAQQTGLSTTEIQNLQTATAGAGVPVEALTHSVLTLSRNMYQAAHGGKQMHEAFTRAGVKIKNTDGTLRSASDVLLDLSDHFSSLPDGMDKTAQAAVLLGRHTGTQLIPLLNKGRQGIEKLASALPNLTEEQIKASVEFVHLQKESSNQTAAAWQQTVAPQLPLINDLYKSWVKFRGEVIKLVQPRITSFLTLMLKGLVKVRDVIGSLGKGVLALVKLFTKEWPLLLYIVLSAATGIVIANQAMALAFLETAVAAVAAAARVIFAWAMAAAPFLAVAAAITTLFLYFNELRVYFQGGRSLISRFMKDIQKWAEPRAEDPWWLAAIKDFTRYLTDAMEDIREFSELMGLGFGKKKFKAGAGAGVSKKAIDERADVMTLQAAQKTVRAGKGLSKGAKDALARAGVSEDAFISKYSAGANAPAAPAVAAPPSAQGPQVLQQNTIQIDGSGLSKEDLSGAVQSGLDAHWEAKWNEKLEPASAAAGP